MDENSFPGTCCQRDNTYLHIYLCLICINAGKDEYKFKRVRGWPVNLLAWLKMQYRNKMLDFFRFCTISFTQVWTSGVTQNQISELIQNEILQLKGKRITRTF